MKRQPAGVVVVVVGGTVVVVVVAAAQQSQSMFLQEIVQTWKETNNGLSLMLHTSSYTLQSTYLNYTSVWFAKTCPILNRARVTMSL